MRQEKPEGFENSQDVAHRGGSIAGNARRDLELQLGRSVITSKNAAQLNHVVKQMIEASVSVTEEEDSENK